MKYKIITIIAAITLFICCGRDDDDMVAYVEYVPKIAIDGWIENGTPAQVIMTWSAPFDQTLDTVFLLKHVIKSARVSVSNGEQTEMLALGVDNNHIPPYVYYGEHIVGEVGKEYTLTIEYNDKVITSHTSIPDLVPLVDCAFEKEHPTDSTGWIKVGFIHNPAVYYQVATLVVNKESVYTPCLYGNIPPNMYEADERISIPVYKGPILFPDFKFETEYLEQDTILLKFRTQNKASYDFWTSWQNEVVNAQNPIFPAKTNLKSNIEGGIGVWSGYGTYTYQYDGKEWTLLR